MYKDNSNRIIGLLYLIVAISFIVCVFIGLNHPGPGLLICRDVTIEKIGACDEYANCRVLFGNGKYGFADAPIEGMRLNDCKKMYKENFGDYYKNRGYKFERRLHEQ